MWTRSELKAKAKVALKRNYWKTVFVALIALALGGAGASVSARGTSSYVSNDNEYAVEQYAWTEGFDPTQDIAEQLESNLANEPAPDASVEEIIAWANQLGQDERDELVQVSVVAVIAAVVLALVALAVAVVIAAFLINPLKVGLNRFFLSNLNQPAVIHEIAYAYDHNYREVVKTMFWRDLRTALWCLLLIVPGIMKAYEYRMIPYLLAEDPTLTKDEAFAQSKRMMTGQKWRAFVLDLSFLGWNLLSAITLGILAVFYVAPYQCMTNAALFEVLRYGQDGSAQGQLPAIPTTDSQVPVPPFASEGALDQDSEFDA